MKFYAKDQHTISATEVSLSGIAAVDCHGNAIVANAATGTVLITDAHPLVPAVVSISTEDKKVDTLEEVTIPFRLNSTEALKSGLFTLAWDDDVLEFVRAEGAIRNGNVFTGAGDFLVTFLAKDQHDVTKTEVSVTTASVTDINDFVIVPSVPVDANVLIHDAHPLVPAKVTMTLADVAAKTETDFEMTLAIATTEALTSLDLDIAYDTSLLTYLSGQLKFTDGVPSSVIYRFHAKENHTVDKTTVTITPKSGVDHNGLTAELPASVVGNVVLADSNPWQPATVTLSMQGSSIDTMTEFKVPVKVTSNEKLTNFVATVGYDAAVLELKGVEGAAREGASSTVKGAGGDFVLKFYAKDQHDVFKTTVTLTGASAVDEHGLIANAIADASADIVIHDAHPLVPAKVTMTLADVAAKTETDFEMTLAIATTEALVSLDLDIAYDTSLLTFISGQLKFTDGVPSSVVYRFHAKENHTVDKTTVTITPKSGVDHNGLAAELPASVVGNVVLADSNPWQPATVTLSMQGSSVDTMTDFKVPVKVTSNEKLTNFVATVGYDSAVLELRGVEGATLAGSTVKGVGSSFTLKFYAKDQHDVFKTTVTLTGASAVDEHGLVAKQIANASCAVVLHDSNPPIPALVAVKVGDASAKTRADVSVVAKVTTTKALANLSFTAKWDAAALELKSVVGATYTASGSNAAKLSVAKFSGSSKEIVLTFHAKEQHTIKKTSITLSGGSAICTEGLAANVSLSDGTVLLTDSNPPVAPTMVVSALDVKAESGKPFIVNVGSESAGGLAQIVMKLEWDASLLTYVGVEESAKVESISANSRRFTFTASGTDNRYHFKFTAASISALQVTSWVKVTAVTATGSNGLAAQLKTALPITSNVLIVREVNKYDPGDINGDGKYTDADLDLLNKYIAYLNVVKTGNKQAIAAVQKYNLTGLALKAADVNRDGKVDANDVSMLAQYIAAAKEVAK